MECKKCQINIGEQDIILKIDEKIIFHVMITGKMSPDDVIDIIENAVLEYVKHLVKSN